METRTMVDAALATRAEAVMIGMVLAGACDKELTRIEAAKKELAALEGLASSKAEADAALAAAQNDRAQAAAILEQAQADADRVQQQASDNLLAANARRADADAAMQAVAEHAAAWHAERDMQERELLDRWEAVKAGEAANKAAADDLARGIAQLAIERAAFNERLEALKA